MGFWGRGCYCSSISGAAIPREGGGKRRGSLKTHHSTIIGGAAGLAILSGAASAPDEMMSTDALGAGFQELGNCLGPGQSEGGADAHSESGEAGEEELELHLSLRMVLTEVDFGLI